MIVVCGQGPAPAAATIERYRELGLDLIPGTGFLAACVPGAFDAWLRMLLELGTARLRDVLEPAIGYARDGHPVLPRVAQGIASLAEFFRDEWPTSAETWLPAPAPWSLFRNRRSPTPTSGCCRRRRRLPADRDEQIQAARDAWYRGFVAEAIDAFVRETEVMDSSGRRHRGLLTADDLAGSKRRSRRRVTSSTRAGRSSRPVRGARARSSCSSSPCSSGSTSGDGTPAAPSSSTRWSSARSSRSPTARRGTATRRSSTCRSTGCCRASTRPSDAPSSGRRPRATCGRASTAGCRRSQVTGVTWRRGLGEPTRGDTCHVDVVDRFGNAVSATPSGGWLQSSPVVPELGFPLGTRAQMFWLEEGLPNSLEPRKRPRTTLSPSLARRDGEVLAFGTPGGDQQDQWSLVFFLHHVHAEREPAGRDRPADVPHEPLPELVLPARGEAAARRDRVEVRAGDDRRAPRARARRRRHRRLVARPAQRGVARRDGGACAPPRTRAACRAMPSAADWVEGLDALAGEFGLGRMHALLDALGNPAARASARPRRRHEREVDRDAHDRGAPARGGLRVGAYLSPHVRGWSERIRVGGEEADFERRSSVCAPPRSRWARRSSRC